MIADRYELIEQIGTGGMATVWKARDTLLGRTVAIKRLLPHLADDPGAAERFKREAQAAAALNHRGIVTVFDTGDDDSGPYIVLELLAGETLAALLARSGPLDPRTVIDFVSQVGVALDHAHGQRVIHRDIKPGNLIVDGNGVVRLTDFGIARTVDDPTTVTATGELVGTISYLAPEILEGERATPASDVYSLAAVTYELLSGKPPFTAETPAALLEAVRSSEPPSLRGIASDEMASAVTKAMAKIPEDRPTSAGLFVTGLIGSATLVMDPGDHPGDPRVLTTSGAGSEEPTLITEALAPGTPGEAGSGDPIAAAAGVTPVDGRSPQSGQRIRWPLFALILGVLALAAAAISTDGEPGSDPSTPDDPFGEAAAVTTVITTIPTTTTTLATTTSIPTTTTTLHETPESVAGEIAGLLATLEPPKFKPKDVRRVEDALQAVMREWERGDDEDLIDELEETFDAVGRLENSPEREAAMEMLIHLAELMGFEVEQRSDNDGESD